MKKTASVALLTALILFRPGLALAQSGQEIKALRQEIEALKQGQTTIQKELLEIKNLLLQKELQGIKEMLQGRQAPAQPQSVVLSVDGAPFKGDKNARVALIEFTDYQCPFCARHFRETLPKIEEEYIKTGKIKYILLDFPIESIHPQAFKMHEAANCTGEQGKYWEMHGLLFANQRAMTPKDLSDHARGLGLDMAKFQQCLDSGNYAKRIRQDLETGQRAGVTGTPSFFLGLAESNGSQVKTLRTIRGAQPYAAFKDAIESLLSSQR